VFNIKEILPKDYIGLEQNSGFLGKNIPLADTSCRITKCVRGFSQTLKGKTGDSPEGKTAEKLFYYSWQRYC